MNGVKDELVPNGSGNFANALEHIAGEGIDDDFLTGDDVTIAQIHSLASSKPSGPISTPPPITVPEAVNDPLPTPSPRTFPRTDTQEAETAAQPTAIKLATLPSPGRTTSNTSSMVSSETGPVVSPLPMISPRSNMSSPGRKPKSARTEQQLSSSTDTGATTGTPKPKRPSGTGGLPRVAMLAANKPAAPKREETTRQRNTPPPFRSGGSTVRTAGGSTGGAATGRIRAPGTPGGAASTPPGASMNSRQRLSGGSASPVPGSSAASGAGSRSSSRSFIASAGASSSSRLATSASTNSRPAWGSAASGAGATRSTRGTNSRGAEGAPGVSRTPPGTVRSTKSLRSTPPPAAGKTPTGTATISRSVSTSSATSSSAGLDRVVTRSSVPSKIPGAPGRNASTTTSTRTKPGGAAATAAVTGAVAAAATAAVVGKAATADQPEEDLDLNTLVGLMGEIKDIRHELDMNTPTAADGTENAEFGSASVNEVEESVPGPEFIASANTVAEKEEGGEDVEEAVEGVVVDNLEKKESGDADGVEDGEVKGSGIAAGDEDAEGETDILEEKLDDILDVAVKAEAAPVVVEEPRPAFEQQSMVEVGQEKIQAKPLCACSIM